MTGAALACALLCFALLGRASRGRLPPRAAYRLRLLAWAVLALSFALAVAARGWVFGPVVWAGLVMLAAGLVFLFLNFARPPERMPR